MTKNKKQIDEKALADSMGLHPVALVASKLASKKGETGVEFTPEAQRAIIVELKELAFDPTLKFAIESLLVVAANLKHQLGQVKAAMQLIAVAETAAMALQEQNAGKALDVQDVAERAQARIRSMTGQPQLTKTAPEYGAAAPAKSFKLGAVFNPGLQPRRRR